jgi:A/G-specific adenine glycosylase
MIDTPKVAVERAEKIREATISLGLRSTVENIIQVAEVLVDRFGGIVPDTLEDLLSLPGVGDYAANAVLCFGFGRPAILMDANTTRVVTRITGHDSATRRWQLRLDLYHLAGPIGADMSFNSALLDLGALVCQAGSPRCLACPVSQHCITFQRDRVSQTE